MLTKNELTDSTYSKDEIYAHVQKIIKDPAFLSADILKRFLLFIVKETLEGRAHCLKEYTIAMSVLDKPASFRPQDSGIVRIHAGRLRRALNKFYDKMGTTDEMRISIPKGNYVPVFENAKELDHNISGREIADENTVWVTSGNEKIKLAVLPFRSSSKEKVTGLLADGIAFQLTAGLQHVRNISVTSFQVIKNLSEKTVDIRELTNTIGSQFILTGGVDMFKDRIRVSIELVRSSSFEQVWSEFYDRTISDSNFFDMQDEIIKSALEKLQESINRESGQNSKIALMTIGRVSGDSY